jgi:transposase
MSRSLSPCPAEVEVERLSAEADHIILVVRAVRRMVPCPGCAQLSNRIHSSYERRLADLPWNGLPVRIRLRARRFFCDTDSCARRIFTERLPETTTTYARRTLRMAQALRWLGLALGGEAGARTAQRLGLVVSGDTLLRHLRRMSVEQKLAPVSPRVLGIDDWAWRKGQRYGTILCDLERHCVVDLLSDRQASTVAEWLRGHVPPEVISRDRAGAYAEAARQGAPHAVQVADRFHLLRNLREALEHVLARHDSIIAEVFRRHTPTPVTPPHSQVSLSIAAALNPTLTGPQQLSQERRQRRFERYEQVIELHQRGTSRRAIASQLGLNRKTVRRWLRAGQFPERQVAPRHSSVDRWLAYLEKRWAEGCHNRSQLWRELQAQGANFAQVTLRRWFRVRLGVRGRPQQSSLSPPRKRPSPRQISALLLDLVPHPSPAQETFAQSLCALSPDIATTVELAKQFWRMLRERDASAWSPWQKAARQSALHHFVVQLQRDEAAVRGAITLPWSTGPVEGHIHRLKLIKRQMYGRAKLDLLRIRVLHAA